MIIKSNKANLYYLSKIKPQILIIHPMLKKIIRLYSNGIKVKNTIKSELYNSYNIRTSNEILQFQYYDAYYHFLNKYGYFEKQVCIPIEKARKYRAEDIKFHLTNTDQITFEVTDGCNLKCKYCGYGGFYEGHDIRGEKNMDFDNAKIFLNYIVKLKKSHYNIKTYRNIGFSFYGGEPLLNFSFIEKMVNYANTLDIYPNKFYFQMTTNGILLDKYITFFIKHNFNISISIDGNKENNSYRVFKNGKSSFNKLTKNIEMLKVKYPNYFKNNIEFISVLHNRNDPIQIEEYFREKYEKNTRILPMAEQNIIENKRQDFDKMQYKKQSEEQIIVESKFGSLNTNKFIKTFCGFVFDNTNSLLSNKKSHKFVCTGTCHPFEKSVFLTVNGKILPCEKIPQKYGLGQVENGKIKLVYKDVVTLYKDLYAKLKSQCNICKRSDECVQCIFYLNLDAKTPKCPDFLSNLQLKKRTKEIMSTIEKDPYLYKNFI